MLFFNPAAAPLQKVTEKTMLEIPQHGVDSRQGKHCLLPPSVQVSTVSRILVYSIKGRHTGTPSRRVAPPFHTFHDNLEMAFEALALLKSEGQKF